MNETLDDLLNEVENAMSDPPRSMTLQERKVSFSSAKYDSGFDTERKGRDMDRPPRQSTPYLPNSSSFIPDARKGSMVRSWSEHKSSAQSSPRTRAASSSPKCSSSCRASGELDELLELIEEIGPISPPQASKKHFNSRHEQEPEKGNYTDRSSRSTIRQTESLGGEKRRCKILQLGAAAVQKGLCTSLLAQCACSNLRCTGCDMNVQIFVGSKWDASSHYMFFRENHPNRQKLAGMLLDDLDACAYCCQCSWISVCSPEIERLNTYSDLRWVCGGHD